MNKRNVAKIAIFLILLSCFIGAVNASEDVSTDTIKTTDDQTITPETTHEDTPKETVSTQPTKAVNDDTIKETQTKLKITNTETTNKTNDKEETTTTTANKSNDNALKAQNNQETLKGGTNTVEVNDYSELITAINNAVQDSENNEYIINLVGTSYSISDEKTLSAGTYQPNIIINGNGNQLSGNKELTISNGCNITFINLIFNGGALENTNAAITLNKVTLKKSFTNNMNLKIINSTIDGSITNNMNLEIINSTLNKKITNKLNLNIINSTLNQEIANSGTLNIDELSTATDNFKISGTGKIYIINTNITNTLRNNKIYINNYSFENENVSLEGVINYGTLSFINCNLTSVHVSVGYNGFRNYGDVTIINSTCDVNFKHNNGTAIIENSTLSYTITLDSPATLIIKDNVIFNPDFVIDNTKGTLNHNNPQINSHLTKLYGNYILSDSNIELTTNRVYTGNITIINCTITNTNRESITVNGNFTIINSTISARITSNNNLTVITSNITGIITNNGILTVNKTILSTISNTGIVVIPIDDDKEVEEVYGPNLVISNNRDTKKGYIETNDMNKLFPYISRFCQDAVVELGNFNVVRKIENYGNLTIENSTLTGVNNDIYNEGTLILKNTTLNLPISNAGTLELRNVTINSAISNRDISLSGKPVTSTLIISDDTQFAEGFILRNSNLGTVITNNTERFTEFVPKYTGNITLDSKTINTEKWNYGNLTLINCIMNSVIVNYGRLIIDDDTTFGENFEIRGDGDIIISNITKLIPYISIINGEYTISNTNLTKAYTFYGTITLENCNITSIGNINYGTLILNNCTVNVGDDNTFLTNLRILQVSQDTTITGKINDLGYSIDGSRYIINQNTIKYFININGLNRIIKSGSTLDIQGKIILNESLRITKAVNIISSTKDGYIDLNTTAGDYFGSSQGNSFIIEEDGSYTNITGVYFHNTQLWLYGTHYVTLDNISAVVEDQRIGSGVGQTSIREHSSHITVKNSYFYTKDNEGSSTLVLALADYCTIENNTIEGDGFIGNLLYLTTYNVKNVPNGIYNSHNKLINNRLRGPETVSSTCYGICISGYYNLIENNTINYRGSGIMFQWGSGITGNETPENESLVGRAGNIVCNNTLYGGCGISAGDLIYNNYMEGKLSVSGKSKAYNNTANGLNIGSDAEVTNNTINGKVIFNVATKNSILVNNKITGDIEIPTTAVNTTISGNNITGTITLDGSFINITNNRIISNDEFAISSTKLGQNNIISNNYILSKDKLGDDAVYLRDKTNIIKNNTLINNTHSTEPESQEGQNPSPTQKIDTKTQPSTTQSTSTPASTSKVSLTPTKVPKTISKKAKKLAISAKVKVGTKVAKKKKVTFIVKGKKYTRKTNNKGVAKLTLTKKQLAKILRKVKAGKKIKVQIKYGKKTITKYIKVKK